MTAARRAAAEIGGPRALTPADAAEFAALVRQAFAGLQAVPPPSALGVTAADVTLHLASGGGGITTHPAQAGLLWAERDGGLYLSRLAVHPDHRGHGLATRLLEAAEAEARRQGLPVLWLATRLAFAGNRRLFARFGFVEGELHTHPGFSGPTFVDMTKRLGWNRG